MITVTDLAKKLSVSELIIEMFSKSLFNEIPVNGFSLIQAKEISSAIKDPYNNSIKGLFRELL